MAPAALPGKPWVSVVGRHIFLGGDIYIYIYMLPAGLHSSRQYGADEVSNMLPAGMGIIPAGRNGEGHSCRPGRNAFPAGRAGMHFLPGFPCPQTTPGLAEGRRRRQGHARKQSMYVWNCIHMQCIINTPCAYGTACFLAHVMKLLITVSVVQHCSLV